MKNPPGQRPPDSERPAATGTEVLLDLGGLSGLTAAEASQRLASNGPNELAVKQTRGIGATIVEIAREPMFLMLVSAGLLYFLLGEVADAAILLAFVVVVVGITVIQERRTDHALKALRDLSNPRALVIRDGARLRVPGREVVPGDLLVVTEGERVPADGLLRRAQHVAIDESLLTGESVPVRKLASEQTLELERPGGEDTSSVFSGSLVTTGQGIVEVLKTGGGTQLGVIGKALADTVLEATPLQRATARVVRNVAVVALLACTVVVVAFALTRGGSLEMWKRGALAGIAMAMSVLPEELPVILTIFLALGAFRLSRVQVLTRRMPAIELLGSATVLCVDKTGTLTCNQMTLKQLTAGDTTANLSAATEPLPTELATLVEYAVHAGKENPFDPMERAVRAAGERVGGAASGGELLREYPLEADRLVLTHVLRLPNGDVVVAAKGAPEAMAAACALSSEERAAAAAAVSALAQKGLRVLTVARGQIATAELPEDPRELKLQLVGHLGFEDPLRAEVPGAIAECHSAGVRVVMITGDYPATAESIARQAGILDSNHVISGPELQDMDDAALVARIDTVNVFARVVPEQKVRIVNALKARGEIVAMTGDGVNDAPALKSAHIGIAMGGRGTDVAREAAALVLLDDKFTSIVAGIRLGRRIYDNIKKAIGFTVAVHVPIAGLSMIPVFFRDWPLLLLPIHIVFLELIIDPVCALVFEAEAAERDVMLQPPRKSNDSLFALPAVSYSVLLGSGALVACLAVFLYAFSTGAPETARALTFATLVAAILSITLVSRSWVWTAVAMLRSRNTALRWVLLGAIAFLAIALHVPVIQGYFGFGPVDPWSLALSLAVGILSVGWVEVGKCVRTPPVLPGSGTPPTLDPLTN